MEFFLKWTDAFWYKRQWLGPIPSQRRKVAVPHECAGGGGTGTLGVKARRMTCSRGAALQPLPRNRVWDVWSLVG